MNYFPVRPTTMHLHGDWMLTVSPMTVIVLGKEYVIPAGRLTDGPSIPPALRWLVSRGDIWMSGIAHDYLRDVLQAENSNHAIDGVFFDLCLAECGSFRKAALARLGVAIGTLIGFVGKPPFRVIDIAAYECRRRGIPLSQPNGPTTQTITK